MSFSERLLIFLRNIAVAHFLSGFFLFIVGWSYGLSKGIVFGIPILIYSSVFFFSRDFLFGFDFKTFRKKLAEIPRIAMTAILLFLILNFLFCLLPPAENLELDALNYHFVIPWQYYLRGGVVPLDWSTTDKYPLYLQMAQLSFTVIGFPWVVKITTMIALPILLVVTWHLCRLMGFPRSNAGWTMALVSGLALFVKQYGTAMFDLANAAYCLLGLLFLLRATVSCNKKDIFWGALILGMACATKTFLIYYALIWFGAYLIWKLLCERKSLSNFDVVLAFSPLVMGMMFLSPIWSRNFFLTGNPFYPLFLDWFGPVIENEGFHIAIGNVITQHGYGRSLIDFFLGPLRLVLPLPQKFGYWTDPVLLTFLFGALIEVRRRWREIPGLIGIIAFLLYSAFFFASQEARYLYSFWIFIVVLGAPWIFEKMNRKLFKTVFVAQVLIGILTFFFFHRQALRWLLEGPTNRYLSRASYSYVWNKETTNKNIKQLCVPNVGSAHRDVFDILYFSVPVKLIQHFNTTMSIRNPKAAEGCDAFLVSTQTYNGRRDNAQTKPMLVSKETFLLEYTQDTYELAP